MKKVLLTLALAAFAFTANAQWIGGGQIGFNHQGIHNDNYTAGSTATTSCVLQPKVGYQLNDQWQVGATIVIGYDYNRNYTAAADNTYNSTANLQFGISPYARYTFGTWKKWSLFAEANFVFGMSPETTTYSYVNGTEVTNWKNGDDQTFLSLAVIPGMNCKLSDNFSMDLYMDVAKLSWSMINTSGFDRHDFTVGINYDPQTIDSYLSLFRIGFNYHF
jgi:opacity protein-like surface antigen